MKTEVIQNLTSKYAIECKNLKIVFNEHTDKEFLVLDDFSYNFEKNKIYFIIGNSGTGKTSLVTHFNGLIKSKYGDIRVGNLHIDNKKRKIKNFKLLRRTVGMVFQFPEYQLFKDTVEKDIIFGPINLGDNKVDAKKKAKKYLNMLGLSDEYLQRSPFGLSGGQKRRVAIAGILAIEPQILIFDEPTAGLDPAGEQEMIDIILSLKKQGKTVIVITHNMDHVLSIGDDVLVLDNKKMITSGTPYEIFMNKSLITSTQLDTPMVINVINNLTQDNKKFEKLYKLQPRNVKQLADNISQIIKGGK
ncbi:MAG: ATP-binding cassette domain-containing protein [Mycoplasmataceae bacterium]|jgi:energy-coupling factor transport system ATP-binding protein|nr:ATP-binding cassette domain-containing protein [Mycoplasmataceae bacterium]